MGKRRKLASATAASGSAAAAPRIKNYLPVRIQWPDATTTFIYVKEHIATVTTAASTTTATTTVTQQDAALPQHKQPQQPTLFVANCPSVANIPTKRLLQAIFGRYGEVVRVTCLANPRSAAAGMGGGSGLLNGHCERVPWNATATLTTVSSHWTNNIAPPAYFQYNWDGPQFAHVVFATSKDLQQTLRALSHAMASTTTSANTDPVIEISTLELQTLQDDEDNANDDDDNDGQNTDTSGILAVAARYRTSFQSCSSNNLMEECNRVVADHEVALAAAQTQRAMAASTPDEDGFVTVSYSNNTVGESVMNTNDNAETMDRAAQARAAAGRAGGRRLRAVTSLGRRRKKKTMGGAEPLFDFYRFQTRESKQKSVHELRRRFAQDVERVQRQKQQGKQA
jgi:Ribosomal RNA-processing protein 7 (RRP7) C-terminal domain